jgi:hypothetical protein
MKTPCEDQTNTNNTLNIAHPALNSAYRSLKEIYPLLENKYFEKVFEETYKCKIEFDGVFNGIVTFNRDKDLTWFLLQHDSSQISGNNE